MKISHLFSYLSVSKNRSDWLILVADLCGTIHIGGPLWTQFDDVVVLVVVFFALFSRSIGFQIFSNLKVFH